MSCNVPYLPDWKSDTPFDSASERENLPAESAESYEASPTARGRMEAKALEGLLLLRYVRGPELASRSKAAAFAFLSQHFEH